VLEGLARGEGLQVVRVAVEEGLHLKSSCTLVDEETLLYWPAGADVSRLAEAGLRCVSALEPEGANVLALGDRVLVSAQAPRTADWLGRHGLDVLVLDVSELHKGDGGLTCLSLRQPWPGCWAT
jgi:dimethylargininase